MPPRSIRSRFSAPALAHPAPRANARPFEKLSRFAGRGALLLQKSQSLGARRGGSAYGVHSTVQGQGRIRSQVATLRFDERSAGTENGAERFGVLRTAR